MFVIVRRFDPRFFREVSALRPYEILVIVDPKPTDEEVATLLTQVGNQPKSLGIEVDKVDNWGKRWLAYDIRNKREGTYAELEAKAEPPMGKDLQRRSRLKEKNQPFLPKR